MLELVAARLDAGSALYVATFNLGIGAGVMVGGRVLEAWGERAVLWTAIMIGTIACVGMAGLVPRTFLGSRAIAKSTQDTSRKAS